jgi:hypothetical protein
VCSLLGFEQMKPAKLAVYWRFVLEQRLSYADKEFVHSLYSCIYARVAEGGKYLSTVQQTANTTCNKAEKSAVQGYNQIVQSHPYFKHCPAFRKAKNECATAGNYGNCMTIKFSVEYQNFENSGICY